MSTARPEQNLRGLRRNVPVFAALGDETRLSLLTRLTRESPCSISRLTEGSRLTRQAITKHLRVLQRAGLVRSARCGREMRFDLEPEQLDEARRALDEMCRQR